MPRAEWGHKSWAYPRENKKKKKKSTEDRQWLVDNGDVARHKQKTKKRTDWRCFSFLLLRFFLLFRLRFYKRRLRFNRCRRIRGCFFGFFSTRLWPSRKYARNASWREHRFWKITLLPKSSSPEKTERKKEEKRQPAMKFWQCGRRGVTKKDEACLLFYYFFSRFYPPFFTISDRTVLPSHIARLTSKWDPFHYSNSVLSKKERTRLVWKGYF